MPYFVFKLGADQSTTLLETCTKFAEAKKMCRELREQVEQEKSKDSFRLMFAKNEKDAKRLIKDKHKPSSPLEEWEA